MYLVFDTETSDLPKFDRDPADKCQPHVVQLAAILCDKRFDEVASFNALIKPNNWIISSGAQNAHGISLDKCKEEGIDIKDALRVFHSFSKLASKYIAFNIKFDAFLLDCECARLMADPFDWSNQYCVMLASTPICKLPAKNGRNGFKWPKLCEAYQHFFNEGFDNAHDAMADVRATARIYRHLLNLNGS